MTSDVPEVDPLRAIYEADVLSRLKRSDLTGTPYFYKMSSGVYQRGDIESEFQSWKRGYESAYRDPIQHIKSFLQEDQVFKILQWANFQCGPIAHLFAATGDKIQKASEIEQAFVLRWFLTLFLENGSDWRAAADAELNRRQDQLRAMRQNLEDQAKSKNR